MNYLNKLEFLLQETVKERKRTKKLRTRQLQAMVKALSNTGVNL
jgi:hypothetical protein